jgi:hypothetical protein
MRRRLWTPGGRRSKNQQASRRNFEQPQGGRQQSATMQRQQVPVHDGERVTVLR